jgi:hypothetical protein
MIHHAVYSDATPRYQRKSKPKWWQRAFRHAWNRVTQTCSSICSWLERNLLPSRKPRRLMTSFRAHGSSRSRFALTAMTVLAVQANASAAGKHMVRFNTHSDAGVGVDNRCSGCILHVKSDFVGDLKTCNRTLKGFGGTKMYRVKMGTLKWSWEDNNGRSHTFLIPDSYYVPDGKVRLLSPQQWAQSQSKNRRLRATCGERTDGNKCVLFWDNGNHNLHIELSRQSYVATFPLARI